MPIIIYQNTAEGGAAGATVSPANSGGSSIDAFSTVSVGSGNSFTYTSTNLEGDLGYQMTQSGANQCNCFWTWTGAQADFSVRFPFQVTAIPATSTTILRGFSDTGYATLVFSVVLTTTGRIQIIDHASGTNASSPSAPNPVIAVGTWYVLEVRSDGPSGVLSATAYQQGSLTPGPTISMSGLTLASINSFRFGLSTSSANTTMRVDDIAIGYGGYLARTDLPVPDNPIGIYLNTAEGGTNGTTVTPANSGGASGDAFSSYSIGAGNTFTYDSSAPLRGALSYKMTQSGANQCNWFWTWSTARADFAFQFPFSIDSLPAVSTTLLRGFSDAGYATPVFSVGVTTTGRLQVIEAAGGQAVSSPSAPAPTIVPGDMYVLQGRSNGPNGSITVTAYPWGSTSTAEAPTVTLNGLSQPAINSFRGGISTASAGISLWFDDIAVGYGGELPRNDLAVNQLPTANLGPSLTGLEPWKQMTLNGTNSLDYANGTVVGYTFRQISGTPTVQLTAVGPICTYKAPGTLTGTTLVFGLVVVDNQGASSSEDTVSHTILPATEQAIVGGAAVPLEFSAIVDGV